ncbi:MAG TPA: hypothetical protein VLT58_03690, partial [Polyangia bacterium]|nr:hypothetical protein [Polyangia bacterium]
AQPSFGGARPHAVVERVRRLATAAPAALPSRGAARRSLATGAAFVLVAIASANLNVTFARPVRDGASDVAAAGQRAAYLTSEEARLQTEMEAAGVVSGGAVTRAAPSHLLELEQDLRHVREERAWLERTVSQTVEP